jgi:hypothetical protein
MISNTKIPICSFLCSFLILSGCVSISFNIDTDSRQGIGIEEKRLHHLVFCWLKDSGNKSHREQIVKATMKFRTIPGVIDAQAGQVLPSDRDIVDDSFDVGILIVTKDKSDLQKYLDHPVHQKAKKEVLAPLVDKIVVYDFLKK